LKKIAILIPCYNESSTIAKVVDDCKTLIPDAEIYVYNNNSADGSEIIAREHGAIVVNEYQQGKGFVIRSMFRDVEADCYIMIDGDDTYEISDAAILTDYILNNQADMVIGDRLSGSYFKENKRRFHNVGNKLVRTLINHIFNSRINDIMTGCRAFNRRFVKTFPVLSDGFEIETEMTIHALYKRFVIIEKPVRYRDRPEGSVSKLNTFSDGVKVIKTIFSLYKNYRPFKFFGTISFLLLIVSVSFFLPVFVEFLRTGFVYRMPTLIVSVGIAIISLLSFICGVILNTVKKYNDTMYELFVNLLKDKK